MVASSVQPLVSSIVTVTSPTVAPVMVTGEAVVSRVAEPVPLVIVIIPNVPV